MTLSIIIPYYNTKEYTNELLHVLNAQIEKDVEVILIDDGSKEPFTSDYKWLRVIRQENKGTSAARNTGIDYATGKYIAFIDSDDIVAKNYIQSVKDAIKKKPDYIELSWKSLTPQGTQFNCKTSSSQPLINPSVCTRVFKREFIGDIRFNTLKDAGEDEEFTRRLDLKRGKRGYIGAYMYYYRTDVKNSQSKKYRPGKGKTRRIIYYLPVLKPSEDLIAEIKEEDKHNEIIVFCNESHNTEELSKYCQILRPFRTWTHELRGEPCNMVEVCRTPFHTQVVFYINGTMGYDGITTFLKNTCMQLKDYYDLVILHDFLDTAVINQLRPIVRVIKRGFYPAIYCDTLLLMRIGQEIPEEVKYSQMFQVVHCTKSDARILKQEPKDCIFVSKTAQKTFTDQEGKVIYNIGNPEKHEKTLLLMSTTRINAEDKGDQDNLMVSFAEELNKQGIKFLWLYFSVNTLRNAPTNMIRVNPVDDVRGYLEHADYLVHLSENEAYCYSIAEALSIGIPIITFDLPILNEFNIKGKGHVVPKDLNMDFKELYKIPKFEGFQITDNKQSIVEWRDVLGDTIPKHDYIPEKMVTVSVVKTYKDVELNRTLEPNEELKMWKDRAEHLRKIGLINIIGG